METEVRTQLGHLPTSQQDDIIRALEAYKSTGFETQDMPRLAGFRNLDIDITETEGSRPVATRPYPVAPRNLPELHRQIKVLLDAGIIGRGVSCYASPVLFAP